MRRVLITGAAGNLGTKLRRHLESRPDYELVLLDRQSRGDPAIVTANLCEYDSDWVGRFAGTDAVVHLAAEASADAPWTSLVHHNIDALLNVFEAAVAHRVSRIVFASSVHAMLGHADTPSVRITTAMETRPTNFYGATKVLGERLARSCAQRHGLSTICLRIGWVPRDNSPARIARGRADTQRTWLSDRDFCGYVEHAITVTDVSFAIVHAISRIDGTSWDIGDGELLLGYVPQDRWTPPQPNLAANLQRALANLMGRAARRLMR